MNVQGISLLRSSGLRGPRGEQIFRNPVELNVDLLYSGSAHGTTLMAFDASEPIDQSPLLEKSVRRYCVKRSSLARVLHGLSRELRGQGVRDVLFVAHQTYLPEDISYSGRIAYDGGPVGELLIEAVRGLRPGRHSFTPESSYASPVASGRLLRSGLRRCGGHFPDKYAAQMLRDVAPLVPLQPQIDFEIYADDGTLFYHDMFLANHRAS